MSDVVANKLYIDDQTKKTLGKKCDENPDIFEIFQDLPKGYSESEVAKRADVIRAQKAVEERLPFKKLEKERKTAALAELQKLGMDTPENIAKINAIIFEKDGILIGKTKRAYENMQGGKGFFHKKTKKRYYDFETSIARAKKQKVFLPTKQDFENTLEALPGKYVEGNWYRGGHILSIILGELFSGWCDNRGMLLGEEDGYLGSVSDCSVVNFWIFKFDGSQCRLHRMSKNDRFVCRPLVK